MSEPAPIGDLLSQLQTSVDRARADRRAAAPALSEHEQAVATRFESADPALEATYSLVEDEALLTHRIGLDNLEEAIEDLSDDSVHLKHVHDFDQLLELLHRATGLAGELRKVVGGIHDRAWALRGEVYGDHHHSTLGVVSVRRTAKSTKWDDETTAGRVVDAHMADTDGEVPPPDAVVRWLLEAGSVNYWRVTALKELGIDPDEEDLRFKTSGNPSITFPSG